MAVSEFMRGAILEEIDDQRGLTYGGIGARPYRWITALTTNGVLLPDVDQLWTVWWSIDTVGRAVAAAQYISCLMYGVNENWRDSERTASLRDGAVHLRRART